MKSKYITPCVTTLNSDRTFDYESQAKQYDHLINSKMDGILILGSIGEFFAFNINQKKELIKFASSHIANRSKLIVGTTSMIFEEIITLSNYAFKCGADSVIVIPPYYFHMNPNSVFDYYDKIASRIDGKMYLYNFPDRTGYELTVQTTLDLLEKHTNIIGYKDTISGMDHTRLLIKEIKPAYPNFEIYSGFDDNFAHNILCGGDGCIGGLSNLYPEVFNDWKIAFQNENLTEISKLQKTVDRLMDLYNVGKPFIPYIKKALELKGIIKNSFSSIPMPQVTKDDIMKIKNIMC